MKRAQFLSFAPPCLSQREIDEVLGTLTAGEWLSSGPKTRRFEEDFKALTSAPSALALNSCTAALHLALIAHEVKPGDQVIVPAMTFCATANVVEHVGAETVLVDVDPDTLLIDPAEVERKMTARTKVIMPVHFAGQPCDMDRINALGPKVVEDAAHCMPAKYRDRWIGDTTNLCCFSFYANKNMTTGEGGMLTGPAELVDRAKVMALHGMSRDAWARFNKGASFEYDVPAPGFKYNMADVAASLGLAQLSRLDELYEQRLSVVHAYDEAFRNSKFASPLRIAADRQSAHHLYILRLNLDALKIDRNRVFTEMQERNIGCSVHYKPLHMMSHYAKKYGLKPEDLPHASHAWQRIISLPLSSKMSVADAHDVIAAIEDVFRTFAR